MKSDISFENHYNYLFLGSGFIFDAEPMHYILANRGLLY
jgi:hypothetical protein